MDRQPLIPENENNHDVSSVLRDSFQGILNSPVFPQNVAENLKTYNASDYYKLKTVAENVDKCIEDYEDQQNHLKAAEYNVMVQQGVNLLSLDEIQNDLALKEHLVLKREKFCNELPVEQLEAFGLLKLDDLMPDKISQSIDFRFNKRLHLCKICESVTSSPRMKATNNSKPKKQLGKPATEIISSCTEKRSTLSEKLLKIDPFSIKFSNFKLGQTYSKLLKLTNVSGHIQTIIVNSQPLDTSLRVDQKNFNCRIAPGISTALLIHYTPSVYRNLKDNISIRSATGQLFIIPIRTHRDPPLLRSYIFKSLHDIFNKPSPSDSCFLEERCEALNCTVDCGTCLVDNFQILNVIMENVGPTGKFFILTEDEWRFQKITNITIYMEFVKDSLWIYPSYFEVEEGETAEIHVIFQPTTSGLFTENLFLICDNNSYQELEVIGDALMFSKNFIVIDIPPCAYDISKHDYHCVNLGNVVGNSQIAFRITVHNKSALNFPYYWLLSSGDGKSDVFAIEVDWISIENVSGKLTPYSNSAFVFTLTLGNVLEGYYNIFLSFFVSNVPLSSLMDEEHFIVVPQQKNDGCHDVQIVNIEVACYVEVFIPKEIPVPECNSCDCIEVKQPKCSPKLKFNCALLDFGILPFGVDVEKFFYVESLSKNCVSWKIVEIKYDVDMPPFMEVVSAGNVSESQGTLTYQYQRKKISYRVIEKGPTRWVSVLLLLSVNKDSSAVIDSICLVAYEVIKNDITLTTGHSKFPILCPLELLYMDLPKTMTIQIENNSLLPGCFCFLTPQGNDVDKVAIVLQPYMGILKPLGCEKIDVTITCHSIGIFENIFVPCFIGIGLKPIMLRVLCVVDFAHVVFYLPGQQQNYQKVLWPPKIVYEHEHHWGDSCLCEGYKTFDDLDLLYVKDKTGHCDCRTISIPTTDDEQENMDEMSLKQTLTRNHAEGNVDHNLLHIVKEHFKEDLFIQKKIVEKHDVKIKTPTKLTFYLENTTPLNIDYTVETTNFFVLNCDGSKSLKETQSNLKVLYSDDEAWQRLCDNDYGIIVQPECQRGTINGFEIIKVTLMIYSNTWGVYLEEVVVELQNVPCFCFSLILEVVGCPIEFPIAINSPRKCPLLRFGNIPYKSESITRQIKINNISTVPLTIVWFISESSNGDCLSGSSGCPVVEPVDFLIIEPNKLEIAKLSSVTADVTFHANRFPASFQKTHLKCMLQGYIYLDDSFACKPNYYYRKSQKNLNPILVEVCANLEMPLLVFNFIDDENVIEAYANDIICNKIDNLEINLMVSNNTLVPVSFSMSVTRPFEIHCPKNSALHLKPGENLEVSIKCKIDEEAIIELSKDIYEKFNKEIIDKNDYNAKIIRVERELFVYQKDLIVQKVPLKLVLHYPSIKVYPWIIKFDNVLIGCTKKCVFSIYNLTGFDVEFQVHSTCTTGCILFSPQSGVIKKSVGLNKQFVDVFVYFSPKNIRQYEVYLKIVTSFPTYSIKVPIRGTGSLNEKFYVDYKI